MRLSPSTIAVCTLLVVGGAALGVRHLSRRCENPELMQALSRVVARDADHDGIVITNVRLVAGQFLAFPYVCEADTTPIRASVDLSEKPQQHVHYLVNWSHGLPSLTVQP